MGTIFFNMIGVVEMLESHVVVIVAAVADVTTVAGAAVVAVVVSLAAIANAAVVVIVAVVTVVLFDISFVVVDDCPTEVTALLDERILGTRSLQRFPPSAE